MTNHNTTDLLHVTEAAALLPRSKKTGRPFTTAAVYKWIRAGRLTPVRVGHSTFVAIADVRRLAGELDRKAVVG